MFWEEVDVAAVCGACVHGGPTQVIHAAVNGPARECESVSWLRGGAFPAAYPGFSVLAIGHVFVSCVGLAGKYIQRHVLVRGLVSCQRHVMSVDAPENSLESTTTDARKHAPPTRIYPLFTW